MWPHVQYVVSTYMIPLQEHQGFAPVLPQQLLSALRQAQLRLPDLLALHRAATPSDGLHHVTHARGLSLAHVLYDEREQGNIFQVVTKGATQYCYVAELTWISVCVCRGSTGSVKRPSQDRVTASSGRLASFPSSFLCELCCVLTGASISPHIVIRYLQLTAGLLTVFSHRNSHLIDVKMATLNKV